MATKTSQISVETQFDDWCLVTRARATAIFKQSVVETISVMQRVGPSVASTRAAIKKRGKRKYGPVAAAGEGGAMPVDKGFLRASLIVALNVDAVPPTRENKDKKKARYPENYASLQVGGAAIGDTISASYSAKYAPYMEERYGFVRLAATQWPQIVARVTVDAKQRVAAKQGAKR